MFVSTAEKLQEEKIIIFLIQTPIVNMILIKGFGLKSKKISRNFEFKEFKMKMFPFVKQYDAVYCGPACLKMIAEYYGKNYSLDKLRDRSNITRLGVSMFGISEAAESIGFRTTGVRINFKSLKNEAVLPCIVHWNQNHFVVVYKIKKDKVYVADPV